MTNWMKMCEIYSFHWKQTFCYSFHWRQTFVIQFPEHLRSLTTWHLKILWIKFKERFKLNDVSSGLKKSRWFIYIWRTDKEGSFFDNNSAVTCTHLSARLIVFAVLLLKIYLYELLGKICDHIFLVYGIFIRSIC